MRYRSIQIGNSLIEVCIGGFLLAFILFSLVSIFPLSLGALRKAQSTTTASYLAQQLMTRVQRTEFASLAGSSSKESVDGMEYSETVTLSDVQPPDPRVKRIDVRLDWDAGGTFGHTHLVMTTCVYDSLNRH